MRFCYSLACPPTLTPQYMDAEKRFKQAQTVADKVS
jgi:hypothetical protein